MSETPSLTPVIVGVLGGLAIGSSIGCWFWVHGYKCGYNEATYVLLTDHLAWTQSESVSAVTAIAARERRENAAVDTSVDGRGEDLAVPAVLPPGTLA